MTAKKISSTGPRGRLATDPREIPSRGWKAILLRVKEEMADDHLPLLSAGVAFYAMLSLVPGLIALVTLFGLFADPRRLQSQIESVAGALPADVQDLLHEQLQSIVASSDTGLGLGLAAALFGALWSASSGMQGLIKAVNATYDEDETRPGWKLRLLAVGLTLGAVVVGAVALGLIAVLPIALERLGMGEGAKLAVNILRWPLLALIVLGALAVVYRYAPDRDEPKWRWVSPGSIAATVLWLVGSGLFSLYVNNFGSYNETYGSLGAVIVLLLWLFLSAFTVLIGGELNAEAEHQTTRDTTKGPSAPRGERGAYVADTLPGEDPPDDAVNLGADR